MLRKLIAKRGLKTFAEPGYLCDAWPPLTSSFVKNALELSDISGERFVSGLLNRKEMVFSFLSLV